ncbi:DUF4290 domain-containing protein [Leptobacterium flavescens]|uniref:DUF4290 domain-containing protein n=1 Tax=Leptobacterium flavescens TaxID=472055 RepID=A0A6P0UH12_9FLAO|nr:DUF4290 domain-containing protein [Leptobacterium flavescens]NER11922.1 DUF4290 domain-containing protein [Leptobacterium flavescens]
MIENIEYNTARTKLIIPEYGRHIQKMVDYAVSIENKEERNKVAQAIIGVMGNLNPHLRDVPDFQHKLWDQIFIMSDFKLDVDSPYPRPVREVLEQRPDRLNYPQNHPKYRFYGNNIKKMIDVANSWEEGDLKQALKYTIANHMKKSYLNWNKDTVEDDVIFQHLNELSGGRINLAQLDEDLTNSSDLMRAKSKTNNRNNGKKNYRNNRNKKRY